MLNSQAFAVLLAVFVLSAIPLVLLAWMGRLRVPPVLRGEIAIKDIALSRDAYSPKAQQVSNAFDNQLQLPVLFYVTAGLLAVVGLGWWDVVLVWAFVISRLVHVAIHVTTNNVQHRFAAFVTGYILLLALWLTMVVRWLMVAF